MNLLDDRELTLLYAAQAERLLRTAYLITGDRQSAEDAVHDAFIEVMRHAGSLRERERMQAWLYRIAVNKAKRSMRRSSLAPVPTDLSALAALRASGPEPSGEALLRERHEMVWQAVQTLPETHREPVILRYYTGLSDQEIAAVLEIPPGTVKSRLYHARRSLEKVLAAAGLSERGESGHG